MINPFNYYLTSFKVGFFLAKREISTANFWSTTLIIFIMTLTFLNLIVVRGILVGLVEGVRQANRNHWTGDIHISAKDTETEILNSPLVMDVVSHLDGVSGVSGRYFQAVSLEANYKNRLETDEPDSVRSVLIGINPDSEIRVNQLAKFIIAGEFLTQTDADQILLGVDLLSQYSIDGEGLDQVEVGDSVRISINNITREVTVKGLIDSKVEDIGRGVFMVDSQVRQLLNRTDFAMDEMAVRLDDPLAMNQVKTLMLANNLDEYATIETYFEAEPAFVTDISNTFSILANIISSISLVVAAITTFIIIFVNAITQKPLIGILKGIGIHWFAIVTSYTLQALFYAVIGIGVASLLIFFVLEPYVANNPIDFPFSDGILLVTLPGTLYRASLLLLATVISGYIPAKMIVNKNTLDSILGR